MSASSFEKTNILWRLQQAVRWVQEWLEMQLPQSSNPPSIPSVSPWTLKALFWVAAVILVVWLGWLIYGLVRAYLQRSAPRSRRANRATSNRKTDLAVAEWLRQAQLFQRQGDYAQACRSLYMAMLQRLHDTKQLPHQNSRTDGEYLQLVQSLPQPQPYQTLINTHERLYFGNAQISAEVFQQCQQAYREIEAQ